MHRARPSSRPAPWMFWGCALALLLKLAMPFLATAAAEQQGKALVEVCTVYGMSMVPMGGGRDDAPADPATGHGADHCALAALTVLAGGNPPPTAAPVAPFLPAAVAAVDAGRAPAADADTRWAARLRHGPPALT